MSTAPPEANEALSPATIRLLERRVIGLGRQIVDEDEHVTELAQRVAKGREAITAWDLEREQIIRDLGYRPQDPAETRKIDDEEEKT